MNEAEFLEKIGNWIKARRDQFNKDSNDETEASAYSTLDSVLDDLREAFHTGIMPWDCNKEDEDEEEDL